MPNEAGETIADDGFSYCFSAAGTNELLSIRRKSRLSHSNRARPIQQMILKENVWMASIREGIVIRKLKSGEYRLYSRKKNPKTGKRRNLGTFRTRKAAEGHERAVQYFKHH
jgi:hypothetical protein